MANKSAKKKSSKVVTRKVAARATKRPSKRAVQKSAGGRRARGAPDHVVFISHSSKEPWIARQIAKEVRAAGAVPWVDVNDIRGGDDFQEAIMEAIRNCTEAIVLVSPSLVNSQWVSIEIGAVAVQDKRVTPVLNNVTPDQVEALRRFNAINLNDFDNYLNQLKERVRPHRRAGRR
jgi:hypothetical protein